jgi:GWxTD domain-containing protein
MRMRSGIAAIVAALACRGAPPVARPPARPALPSATLELYQRAGVLTGTGDLGAAARVHQLASGDADTAHILVGIAMPARGLAFVQDGDAFRAAYEVVVEVRRDTRVVYRAATTSDVRVAQVRDAWRPDESVIFQHTFRLGPGEYVTTISVRDTRGQGTSRIASPLVVPFASNRPWAQLAPVYRAPSRARTAAPTEIVLNPRGMVILGRDSVARLYLETSPAQAGRALLIRAAPRGDVGAWVDSVTPVGDGIVAAALVEIPVEQLGVGIVDVSVTDPRRGATLRIPIIVSLGEELPVASLEEAVDYLRFFVTDDRLRPLRDPLPERRAAAWRDLMRSTDPVPSTAEHEALREYVRRIVVANSQFREEGGPGWLTDRGMVLATLGEPDGVIEPPSDPTAVRTLTWEYRRHRLNVAFTDVSGFGRWRITTASDAELHALIRALGPCLGCR